MSLPTRALLSSLVLTTVSAQYGPGGNHRPGPGGGNWGPPGANDNFGPFGSGQDGRFDAFFSSRRKALIAHGVLASLAFVLFFPVGAMLIRLGSFRGVWLVHGVFQLFAYIIYTAAFGIGVWMINDFPLDLRANYHPLIGIVVFVLLFFQPILGYIHHLQYKKYTRRTLWSYGHLWLGRIAITLGMINGGLGLLLASDAPLVTGFAPTKSQMIAYGVVAGIMWLLWVVVAIIGERKRGRGRVASKRDVTAEPPTYKEHFAHRVPSY